MHSSSIKNVCDVALVTKNTKQSSNIPGHSLLLRTGKFI